MIKELISMGGHGIFVWSSFIFTLACCALLYLKTKRDLKKQEKKFLNQIENLSQAEIEIIKEKKVAKDILVGKPVFHQ